MAHTETEPRRASPLDNSFRWAVAWAIRRLNTFLVGTVVLTVLSLGISAYVTRNALLAFAITVATLVGAVLVIGLIVAPHLQLHALRLLLRAQFNEAARMRDRRFQEHLKDQQDFAKRSMGHIFPEHHGVRSEGWWPIPFSQSELEAMHIHFPEAAEAISK